MLGRPTPRFLLVILAAALVWAANGVGRQGNAQQSPGATDQTQTANPGKESPYVVEKQLMRCKACTGTTGKPPEKPQAKKDPINPPSNPCDSLKKGCGPTPNNRLGNGKDGDSNIRWEHPLPSSGSQKPEPQESVQVPELPNDEEPPPLGGGTSPSWAIAMVGASALIGLFGSLLVLKYRFAREFRANGDVTRSKLFHKQSGTQSTQPWQKKGVDPGVFQFETALRRELISRAEFRELRSRYVIAGNFCFSMLAPLWLMLILIATGVGQWYQRLAVEIAATLVTMLLTTFALDRRHKFRSEYRTLILQNLKLQSGPNTGKGDSAFRLDDTGRELLAQIGIIFANFLRRVRATETSGEKTGEKS